jgi:hypothetical protein
VETEDTNKPARKNGLTRASELPKRQYVRRRPTDSQQAKLDQIRERIQTTQLINRLQANALADREFMSPGQIRSAEVLLAKTMPNLQSQELKVEGAQTNVLRAPEPLANDQWEAKYGAKKVN